jgi:hypothetical protein
MNYRVSKGGKAFEMDCPAWSWGGRERKAKSKSSLPVLFASKIK